VRLEGADVGRTVQREAALIGGDAADRDAGVDGGAVGLKGDGLGGPAVIAEGRQAGVGDVEQVVVSRVEAARAPSADQVVVLLSLFLGRVFGIARF
jgi:hypothetical protein